MADSNLITEASAAQAIPRHHQYVVQDIFRVCEVHLVAGTSGSGKTTWLLLMIQEWSEGRDVLGRKSYPQRFLYVACDRSLASVRVKLELLGIAYREVDQGLPVLEFANGVVISSIDNINITGVNEIIRRAVKYEAPVVFIEGLGTLVPKGKLSDYNTVAEFLKDISRGCQKHGLTVIGTVHEGKSKPGEGYKLDRQRLFGSVAWPSFSETIVFMEHWNIDQNKPGTDNEEGRRVGILLRDGPSETHFYEFEQDDNGTVKLAYRQNQDGEGPGERGGGIDFAMSGFLKDRTVFTTWEAVEWGERKGYKKRRVMDWLRSLVDRKLARHPSVGKYEVIAGSGADTLDEWEGLESA